MKRSLYVFAMRLRRKHVLADDCWCRPRVETVPAREVLPSVGYDDVSGFVTTYVRRHNA